MFMTTALAVSLVFAVAGLVALAAAAYVWVTK